MPPPANVPHSQPVSTDPAVIQAQESLYIVLTVLFALYFIVPIPIIYKMRNSMHIRKRMPWLMIICSVVGLITCLFSIAGLDLIIGSFISMPSTCILRIIEPTLIYPFWLFVFLLRSAHLVCLNTINKARLVLTSGDAQSRYVPNIIERVALIFYSSKGKKNVGRLTTAHATSSGLGSKGNISESTKTSTPISEDNSDFVFKQSMEPKMSIIGKWLAVCLTVQLVDIMIQILMSTSVLFLDKGNCNMNTVWIERILEFVILILMYALLGSLYKVKDFLWITHELVLTGFLISMATFVRIGVEISLHGIGNISFSAIPLWGNQSYSFLGSITAHLVTVIHPILQAYLHERRNKNLKLDKESFNATLKDKAAFDELKAVMAAQFCIENAMFFENYLKIAPKNVLDVLAKKEATQASGENLINAAAAVGESGENLTIDKKSKKPIKKIFEDFIQSGSKYELNIPEKVKNEAVKAFSAGGSTNEAILLPIAAEVYQMVYENSYPRFFAAKSNKSPQ